MKKLYTKNKKNKQKLGLPKTKKTNFKK